MLWFNKRNELAKEYERWADENNVKDCALSCISFLAAKHLLNEEACLVFLKCPIGGTNCDICEHWYGEISECMYGEEVEKK